MGDIRPAPQALLFVAVTVSDRTLMDPICDRLTEQHGPILDRLEPFLLSEHTNYYEQEMGAELWKTFVVFRNVITVEHPACYKHESNRLEESYAVEGRRRANIDPGYLTLFNFCLLTTKGFAHRVYLEDGIWVEVTLKAHDRRYHPLPWTYADYKTPEALAFLESGRRFLKENKHKND